jgi:hypothetical protein
LKVGAPVILSCKFSPKTGMCNRTPLRIARLIDNYKEAKLLSGAFNGNDQFLPIIIVMPNVFSHDHFYVAMSRGTGMSRISHLLPKDGLHESADVQYNKK